MGLIRSGNNVQDGQVSKLLDTSPNTTIQDEKVLVREDQPQTNTTAGSSTINPSQFKFYKVPTIEENRSRRILRQGIVQAVVQSPALAGLQFRGLDEYLVIVKDAANKLISFVEEA